MKTKLHPIAALTAAALASARVAILTADLQSAEDGWYQLLPAGAFKARDGRPHDTDDGHWHMSADIAASLIARAAALGQDILIDYEHQTLNKEKNGQPAPAAGWFDGSEMQWRDGAGLYIKPRWTDNASAYIAAKEYRFLSAVFPYDAAGHPLEIRMAAITNDPGVVGMEALAALAASLTPPTETEAKESDMDEFLAELLVQLRWSLNLPTTATPQDIQAELQKVIDMIKAQVGGEAALTSQGLAAYLKGQFEQVATLSAKTAEQTTKIATLTAANGQTDLTQFVPKATYDAVVQQVAALSAKTETQSVDSLIKEGREKGKLLACEEDYARQFAAQQGVAALSAMIEARPGIAALTAEQQSASVIDPNKSKGVAVLTATQEAAAKARGISAEQYKAEYLD
ncbi:phage protease [Aeromonas enteropelogenes]|uniref:phage protease n=1 Tax=Aeromonas enteropelogenes TaxID=29489 RepID=UPI003B9F76B9